MGETGWVILDRGILRLSGPDVRPFLQGLISNDIERVGGDRAIYAALLTPQGKYLFDLFVYQDGDSLLIDAEGARLADLHRRLMMYRLRAKVEIEDAPGLRVAAILGDEVAEALGLRSEPGAARALEGGVVAIDPRLAEIGARALLPEEHLGAALAALGLTPLPFTAYETRRLELGLPESGRDLVVDKSILLESGFEELHGVDFDKGCFVGQELTARTKHRGLVRKRLMPVVIEGGAPEPGTQVLLDGRDAGELRSSHDGRGLALLRLDRLAQAERDDRRLTAGEATLRALRPGWMVLPEAR
jgi:folate-binding protein YgfZ